MRDALPPSDWFPNISIQLRLHFRDKHQVFPSIQLPPFDVLVVYQVSSSTLPIPLYWASASKAFINSFLLLTSPNQINHPSIPFATMAIYSSVPPPSQQAAIAQLPLNATVTGVDIESWSATAISSLNISSSSGVTLSIPLDAERENARRDSPPKPRKELMRRDSQKKREALLRGKEGSRRRQRWENGE